MKKTFLLFILFVFSLLTFGQDDQIISTKLNGYVRYEAYYETYKSVTARDGELILYPAKPVFDTLGNDINEKGQVNMLGLQSRIKLSIAGKEALGAKTSGVIEVDFLGTANDVSRMLRLRHAFFKLDWGQTNLIMGHYWHPVFVLETFPPTLTFGAGMPFHPLNRSPQIRITQELSDQFTIMGAALVGGYHKAVGPADQHRNSGIPEMQFQAKMDLGTVLFGVTAGYKWLTPRLITDSVTRTTETIGSYNIQGFLRIKTAPVTARIEYLMGENLSNYVMIGGYAMKAHSNNPEGDYRYTNLPSMSALADFQTNGKTWVGGLFLAYMANQGAKEEIDKNVIYARSTDIDYVYRIAPRIIYHSGNTSFGLEYNITGAVYGKEFDEKLKVTEKYDPVINHRVLLTVKYAF